MSSAPHTPSPLVPPRPPDRRLARVLIGALILATLGYYYLMSVVFHCSHHRIHGPLDDHYNLLAHGFRKGQLSLDLAVPQALIDSPNPYDPAQRPHVSPAPPHDCSYYRGRYYIYFGPAPVATLFLPFALATGHDLPLPVAILLYCSAGYLVLVALFFHLQRRHFPAASTAAQLACLLTLGGGTMTLALLRRPNIWEVAGSAGFFFFTVTLYCLVRALASRRAPAWAAAGGLALGLAVASRPTYLVCCALFALPLLRRRRPGETPAYGWRALAAAATTCGAIGGVLLAYNYARFDHPLEFGQRYQLSSIIEGDARHFSLGYLAYNLEVYLGSTLRWFGAFPFVRAVQPPPSPPGHAGHEFSFGLLPNLPFVIFAGVLIAGLAWRRGRASPDDARWPAFGVIAAAGLLTLAPLALFFGSCIRYMADFTPSLMLLACGGLLEAEARLRRRAARLGLQLAAGLLAVFGVVVSGLALVDAYDPLPGTPPASYAGVARLANAPGRWLDRRQWPDYGPWDLSLVFPADGPRRREPLLTVAKRSAPSAIVFVEYLDPPAIRFGYHEGPGGPDTIFSPAVMTVPGRPHALRLTVGELDTPLLHGTKSWLRLVFDGRVILISPSVSPAAFPGRVTIGSAPESARAGLRFTGQILQSGPAARQGVVDARPFGGARVRLSLHAGLRRRALPLATTGVSGAGDFLFVRLRADDQLEFGYDHWGAGVELSAPIPVPLDQAVAIEFWLPALAPGQPPPPLRVHLDGRPVWTAAVSHFPCTPETVFFGYNPIGGTTTENVLDSAIFEETRLPFPPR